MDKIQIHYEREMDYVEEIDILKCRLSEKEKESIMTVTNLKNKMCQFQVRQLTVHTLVRLIQIFFSYF